LNSELISRTLQWILVDCENAIRSACEEGKTVIYLVTPSNIDHDRVKNELIKAGYQVEELNSYQIKISWALSASTVLINPEATDRPGAD
jgi:hypothetical protein